MPPLIAPPRPLPVPMTHHLAPSPSRQHQHTEHSALPPLPHHPQLPPLCPPSRSSIRAPTNIPNKMSLSHLLDSPARKPAKVQRPVAEAPMAAPVFPELHQHSSNSSPHLPHSHHHVETVPGVPSRVASPSLQLPQSLYHHKQHLEPGPRSMSELSGVTLYREIGQNVSGEQEQEAFAFPSNPHTHSLDPHRQRIRQYTTPQQEQQGSGYEHVSRSVQRTQSSPDFFGYDVVETHGRDSHDSPHYSRSPTGSPLNQPLRHLSHYPPHSKSDFQYDRQPVYETESVPSRMSYQVEKHPSSLAPPAYLQMGKDRMVAKTVPLVHEPKTKRPWTEREDAQLRDLTASLGVGLWAAIAEHIPGRTGKQVRERWLNHLSPTVVKRPWSPEEDQIIIAAHAEYGSSWSKICKLLDGRSENMCKNRFWTKLCKLTQSNGRSSVKSGDRAKLSIQRPLSKR